MKPPRVRNLSIVSASFLLTLIASHEAFAQICRPVGERTGEVGCWIIANTELGQLPQSPIFWHLDTYPTRAQAERAKGPRGTVVESFGRGWLLTIDVAGWRPAGGARVAEIGPLPVSASAKYSAQYMEAVFTPGMTAPAHRHSGPEAWYTLAGETCLETLKARWSGEREALTSLCRVVRPCISPPPAPRLAARWF